MQRRDRGHHGWALLAVLVAFPASAAAQIDPPPSRNIDWVPTQVETLSVEPPRFRVHFKIENADPTVPVCEFNLRTYVGGSSPIESCAPQVCEAPVGWQCYSGFDLNWTIGELGQLCVGPGETVEGFAFITAGESCCWLAEAMGPLFNVTARDALCIGGADVVQVDARTWGSLKAIYR